MRRYPRVARLLAPLVLTLGLVLTFGAPASAQQAVSDGTKTNKRTISVALPVLDQLDQLKLRGPDGTVVPLINPDCPQGWADGFLNVQWLYNVETRITVSSVANYQFSVACVDLAFESIAAHLVLNGTEVSNDLDVCGKQGSASGECAHQVLVAGSLWACSTSCWGQYVMTTGAFLQLPAGWEWVDPAPPCHKPVGANDILLCNFSAGPINVPYFN